MSEAGRLLSAGTDQERALLRAGADEEPSKESVLAAARALGLAPRAVAVVSLASLAAILARAVRGSSMTTIATWVVAPVVVVSAVATAVLVHRAPVHAAVAPAPSTQAPSVPPAVTALTQVPATSGPSAAPTAAAVPFAAPGIAQGKKGSGPAVSRSSQDADLAEQVRLVDRARELAASGDAPGALAAVDTYDHRFAHGILSEEAALVRIQATQARGEHAEAASLARRFLAQYPESVHRSKVQWLLGDGTK